MTPRPEHGKADVSSSDEDCATLVKPGQLNNFNQNRNETIRRRLEDLTQIRDQFEHVPQQRMGYNNESEIELGNRVIVKEKYTGTCRYIGPIQETYISPEIFIGIELDDKLTQNDGVFGSKKYFECEFGYGLMVPVNKVKNMVQPTEKNRKNQNERKEKIKRSKSVADLSRMVKTTNWMENERKISPGFTSITRSKSSSNLNRREPHPINDADPRDILNHIKKWQPNFDHQNQYNHQLYSRQHLFNGSVYGHDTMVAQGLPLQYPSQSKMSEPSGEMNDALRNSFARIMNVRPTTPTNAQYYSAPLSTPISYVKAKSEIYFDGREPFSDSKSVLSFRSAPEFNRRVSHGAGSTVGGFLNHIRVGRQESEPSIYNASMNGGYQSNLSRTSSIASSSYTEQKPYLQSFTTLNRPLCATCAACTTCGGPERASFQAANIRQQIQDQHNAELNEYKNKQEIMRRQYELQQEKLRRKNNEEKVRRNQILHQMKNQRIQNNDNYEADEYEQWKAQHGEIAGRSMKRGLSKLQNAVAKY